MAQVPTYNNQEVKTRPLAQQGFNVQASAQDMGGGVARGVQGLASGIGNAANAMAQLKQLEDENIAKERHNEFLKSTIELSYGENGYYSKSGKDAVTQRGDYNKLIEEKRKEFANGLTPEQAALYGRAAESTVMSSLEGSAKHALSEHKAWFNDTSTARVDTFLNAGLAAYQAPDEVNKYIAAAQSEIRARGEMLGWDQATTRNAEMKVISSARSSVVMRQAQDDPLRASAYYEAHKDQITGEDQVKLDASLDPSVRAAKAQNFVQSILSEGRAIYSDNNATVASFGKTPAREFIYSRLVGHDASHVDNLNNNFVQNLSAMIHDAPPNIREGLGIFSGARSYERQQELFDAEVRKRGSVAAALKAGMVAPPGRSLHEHGKAADLSFNGQSLARAPKEVIAWVHQNAGKYNMHFPMSYENWHIEPMGTRDTKAPSYIVAKNDNIGARTAMPSQDQINAKLDEIADPKERELARATLAATMANQVKAIEEQQKEHVKAVWELASQGLTPAQIRKQNPELMQAVGQQEELKILKVQKEIAEFGAVKDNPELVSSLNRYAASDPDGFSQVNLYDHKTDLSDATLKSLEEKQNAVRADRNKAFQTGAVYKKGYDAVDRLMVYLPTEKDKDAADKRKAQIEQSMRLSIDNFIKTNPDRQLSDNDYYTMAAKLVSIKDVQRGTFRDTESYIYERDPTKTYDNSQTRIAFENIPKDIVANIRDFLYGVRKKAGQSLMLSDITPMEIEVEWRRRLARDEMTQEERRVQIGGVPDGQ